MKIPGFENEPFEIEEFVPKGIFRKFGANSIWYISKDVVESIVYLRHWFNAPIILNNWHVGGEFQNRVFRQPDCPTGAFLSQHKFKDAADFNVNGLTSKQVCTRIIDAWPELRQHVKFTTMENMEYTRGWTHMDCRWHEGDDLLIVNP